MAVFPMGDAGGRLACVLALAFAVAGCRDAAKPASPRLPEGGLVDGGDGGACEPFLPAYLVGSFMATGLPCLDCHGGESADGPRFYAAGTVFDELSKADRCRGVADVEVVVTESDGTEHRRLTNYAGNFYFEEPMEPPLRARVEAGGRVRVMGAEVGHGNCNACHTAEGEQEAPGRIVVPWSN